MQDLSSYLHLRGKRRVCNISSMESLLGGGQFPLRFLVAGFKNFEAFDNRVVFLRAPPINDTGGGIKSREDIPPGCRVVVTLFRYCGGHGWTHRVSLCVANQRHEREI